MKEEHTPVITGIGLISGLGIGKETNWKAMVEGMSGIRPITRFDCSRLLTKIAGELPRDFEAAAKKNIRGITLQRTALFTQLAILGTMDALADSGIDIKTEDPHRVGVILGNCFGGMEYLETKFREFSRHPHRSKQTLAKLCSCLRKEQSSIHPFGPMLRIFDGSRHILFSRPVPSFSNEIKVGQ